MKNGKFAFMALVAIIGMVGFVGCGSNDDATKTYTVTFNSNGGTEVDQITGIDNGSTITEPTVPIKGYAFLGWYKESALNNMWNFDTDTVTNNITLHAKWGAYNGSLNVGDAGPGGGKIFYRSETAFTMTDDSSSAHYLEAAPDDMPDTIKWMAVTWLDFPNYYFPDMSDTATGIGTGRKNTALIIATDVDTPAAQACKDYTGGGKTDWYLPSKDELEELCKNKDIIGNLKTVVDTVDYSHFYCSSSQAVDDVTSGVWLYLFGDYNCLSYSSKDGWYSVRPIRAF